MGISRIETDTVLSETLGEGLSKADLVSWFKEGHDEKWTIAAIKKHLRTQHQRETLNSLDISIEDMLNGRVEGEYRQAIVEVIFHDWNEMLGANIFGYNIA